MDEKAKIDINQVKPGMIWYEDNTFSFDKQADKKIKAIVELVENGVIYGDLMASEMHDISDVEITWPDAKKFFKEFSYPCEKNEKIVWYNIDQFRRIYDYDNYHTVKKAFDKLQKVYRIGIYWSSSEYYTKTAWYWDFYNGKRGYQDKNRYLYIRPALGLEVE
jgi:hypothetical protein